MKYKENAKALVCGASGGIGLAVAQNFSNAGVKVTLVSRTEEKLKKAVGELYGDGHDYIVADLSQKKDVQDLCQKIAGKLYLIYVNNAGGPKGGPLLEAEDQEFQEAFQTHVLSAQEILKTLVPQMKKENWGRVINIISTSVKIPIPNLGVSNTIRGAVASWSKTLSLELAPHNITVNNVLPGYTETSRLENLVRTVSQKTNQEKEVVEALWKTKVPMGRFGQASEVAQAVSFLSSLEASYVNGVSLAVDGGRTGAL